MTENQPRTSFGVAARQVRRYTGPNSVSDLTNVLQVFRHGQGDACQFTSVLKHLARFRPDWVVDTVSLKGKHSAFFGLVRKSYVEGEPLGGPYDLTFDHDWLECRGAWPDSPGTKTVYCIRHVFKLVPQWDLLTYSINVRAQARERAGAYVKSLPPAPFVLLHYERNTLFSNKNLSHDVMRCVCNFLLASGLTPVILDWDHRSPIPDNSTIFCPDVGNPLWMQYGTGDTETLAALIERAALLIGIDSGPQKVAFATTTPTLAVWIRHHPYHYADNTPNAVHLIPENHADYLRGSKELGLEFFRRWYRHVTYSPNNIAGAITELASRLLRPGNRTGPTRPDGPAAV